MYITSAAFADPQLRTVPLQRFHPFNKPTTYPSTILGKQYDDSTVIIIRDFADAFNNFDCADELQQICRYPLMVPQISFDDSTDKLQITHATNSQIP